MTNKGLSKRHKLSYEILGLIGISALLALILFLLLSHSANAILEMYIFNNDIVMTEFDWIDLNMWVFGVSAIVSICFFSILFLILLADRITYIRKITKGIDALRMGQQTYTISLEGNNELTELAGAINFMSVTQRQIREKEQTLAQEKEQLIRTLSHDIRTPLTSILAYSDYLSSKDDIPSEEQKDYMQLIRKKAEQIRDLTDILLDGSKRNPERFEDAHLLMEQLAAEFEEGLEDQFQIATDLSGCPTFTGTFDVQELRRIFDNLSSNVQKYADPTQTVKLSIFVEDKYLLIRQSNAVLANATQADSYKLGIPSIRRIAQHYGGQVTVQQDFEHFTITISISIQY